VWAAVLPVGAAGLLLGAWWTLCGTNRWVLAFLAAAVLLPPLPLPGGDSGPHPAMAVALIGLAAGLARLPAWRFRLTGLSTPLLFFFWVLAASVPLAALYSGAPIALGTLARVGLAGIALYLFFYLSQGPGRELPPDRLVRWMFWTGVASAAFACLDFYFQWPAPARFAEQFVWLPQGVFRRAQGVFYEASTLGSFCNFLLVLIACLAARPAAERLGLRTLSLAGAAVILLTALMLSFSRAAVVSLGVALAVLAWFERDRLRSAAKAVLALGLAAFAGALVLWVLTPDFLGHYGARLRLSAEYLAEAPNQILSRRLETWQLLWGWIQQNPLETVWGIGYKTLPYTTLLGRPVIADNMYLSALIEVGWLGLAALLMLNGAILVRCWGHAKRGNGVQRLLGLWMFCFWCGQIVQMSSGDILTYWRILPAFFSALAILEREDPVSGPVF
jgi:O-antigen ligase